MFIKGKFIENVTANKILKILTDFHFVIDTGLLILGFKCKSSLLLDKSVMHSPMLSEQHSGSGIANKEV